MTPPDNAHQEPPPAHPICHLEKIIETLRGPQGCPWDKEQSHHTLRAALVEESYEVMEAIDRGDDAHLCEELGDLLVVVAMHAQIARERGVFSLGSAANAAAEKMVRRHPHVFGDSRADTPGEVLRQWEEIKQQEKGKARSLMDGLSRALPALMRAQTAQKKAGRVGFDWPDAEGAKAKLMEEFSEVEAVLSGSAEACRIEEELGDFLFAAVNWIRKLGFDAETALAGATEKFIRRFREMEQTVEAQGKNLSELSLQEMDAVWEALKSPKSTQPASAVSRKE